MRYRRGFTVSEPSLFSTTSTPLPRSQATSSFWSSDRIGSAAGASAIAMPSGSRLRSR